MWSCCIPLLSCLQGGQPLEGRVRPEGVALGAPTISQDLGLRSCGEWLGVEELIPEPAVVDEVERSSYDAAKPFSQGDPDSM
jgi:hypothetical protein